MCFYYSTAETALICIVYWWVSNKALSKCQTRVSQRSALLQFQRTFNSLDHELQYENSELFTILTKSEAHFLDKPSESLDVNDIALMKPTKRNHKFMKTMNHKSAYWGRKHFKLEKDFYNSLYFT